MKRFFCKAAEICASLGIYSLYEKYYTSISSCLKASIDGSRILKMHIRQIRFSVICILMCCCKSCIMTSSRRPVIIMMDQTAELVLDAIIVSQMLLMCPEFLIHNGWWGEKNIVKWLSVSAQVQLPNRVKTKLQQQTACLEKIQFTHFFKKKHPTMQYGLFVASLCSTSFHSIIYCSLICTDKCILPCLWRKGN